MVAKEKFGEWFKFYHQCCPIKPEPPGAPTTAAASGTEKAYLEKVQYETKAAKYKEEMKR